MHQRVVYHETLLDSGGKPILDKYGKAKTVRYDSIARVQRKSQLVRDTQGTERRVSLEIDLPPEIDPEVGSMIEYELVDARMDSGSIIAKDEAVNLAGNRIYYRTVYVDG